MMKSFFKKLSLVMALAMVVTLAAPAAQAFAADLVIAGQKEAKADAKEEYSVAVDDEVDLKFYGAAAGWQDLYKWESSDETIAKPLVNEKGEQDGRFEGLKDGVVDVTLTIGEQKATVKLVVGKGEVVADNSFEVKQLSANVLQLTFADKAYATKDVAVEKIIKTADGEKPMVWVLNTNKTTLKDNVVTIEPWVPFGTATYNITVNGETVTFDTKVGDPAVAELSYAKPYTYAEAGEPAAATLKVTDANGVEVAKTAYTVYYELVAAEPSGYAYVNSANGDLYFYADNAAAAVKVTVQYYVGTELQKFDYVTEVVTQKKPVATIIPALDAVAVIATGADKDKIVWGSSEVKIADATTYQVVGLIKNSFGDSFSINTASQGTKDEAKNLITGYTFGYTSTDTSKVLVNATTGELVGVNVGSAYVLVTMYTKDANNQTVEVGIVAAVPVTVQAAKAASYVTLGTDAMAVLLTTGHYTTKTVTPKTYNQYNEEMADTIASVSTTFNNVTHNATISADGKSFTINAADADAVLNAGAIKSTQFTYKVTMTSGKTTDFVLNIKTVPGAQNEVYKLSVSGAEVKVDDLTKKVSVSVVSEVLGEKFENEDFFYGKVDASVAQPGDIYVVVLDKDQKVITPATTAALTTLVETAAVTKNASGEAITTLGAGAYTVQLYKVIAVNNGVVLDTKIDDAVYTVTNSLPTVATEVKADLDVALTVEGGKVKLAAGAVTFKVNNESNDGTTTGNFTIGDVNAVKVSTDKTFVYDFKVQYKVGNGYVEITVPVNQTFNLQ